MCSVSKMNLAKRRLNLLIPRILLYQIIHDPLLNLLLLGNPQEGDVTAVQWMSHEDPTCGRPCHAEWWSGGPSSWRALQQWAAHEEVHANFCACSRGEYSGCCNWIKTFKAIHQSDILTDHFHRVLWQTSSMSTMTFSDMRTRCLGTLKQSLTRVRHCFVLFCFVFPSRNCFHSLHPKASLGFYFNVGFYIFLFF